MSTKIELKVSEKCESTSFPWWAILDSAMLGGGRSVDRLAGAITGPFFSRDEAEAELGRRRYDYSDKAVVYCLSGCNSGRYKRAMALAESHKGGAE